ncbi:hypothetical protein PROFUN_00674 [Planoprotostelium fungivorum]|uniref:Uncharacterized protein n=1 Tax=Planoprotostelium fungivorum TaxID=1890364 RepID=A0A2P6NU16_9EUKA|nr:hypothetical protein PROFUN_00674 [Planoprotostelium fungivorum]
MRCRLTTEDCHLSLLYIEYLLLALVLKGSEVDAAISHVCLSTRGKHPHHNKRPPNAEIERVEREKTTRTSIHGDTEAISSDENEGKAMASDGDDNEVIRSSDDDNVDTPETFRQERGSAPLTKRNRESPQTSTRQRPTLDRQTFTPDTKMDLTHLKED